MLLTKKMALVDYQRCQPDKCPDGICQAAQACALKLLRQEAPYSPPMPDPFSCRVCGDCVHACPCQAIKITST